MMSHKELLKEILPVLALFAVLAFLFCRIWLEFPLALLAAIAVPLILVLAAVPLTIADERACRRRRQERERDSRPRHRPF